MATNPRTCPQCKTTFSGNERLCPKDGSILEEAAKPAGGKEADPHIGQTLAGKYRIDGFLSRGGMGAVYRATHVMLSKPIAIKLIHPSLVTSAETVKRFQREARAASMLTHPNIVTVHDLGQAEDGTLYIAMELVPGSSLKQLIQKDGAFHPMRCARLGRQIASALSLAHRHNIVHRDLKPQNVVITKNSEGLEEAKLLDFGIAKTFEAEDGTALTSTGMVIGTPQYMSPEQAAGKAVDGRSDVYSLGVILYEMMTGEVPFNDTSITTILYKHVWEAPKPPSERRPDLAMSPELEAIALRCLNKEADKRYTVVDDLLAELKAYEQAAPTTPARGALGVPEGGATMTLSQGRGPVTPAGAAHAASAQRTPAAAQATPVAGQPTPAAAAAATAAGTAAGATRPTAAAPAARDTAPGVPQPVKRTNWGLVAALLITAFLGVAAGGGYLVLRATGLIGGRTDGQTASSDGAVPTGQPAMALSTPEPDSSQAPAVPDRAQAPAEPPAIEPPSATESAAGGAVTTAAATALPAPAERPLVETSPPSAAERRAQDVPPGERIPRTAPGEFRPRGERPRGAVGDGPRRRLREGEEPERGAAARGAALSDALPARPPVFFRCEGNAPPACMAVRAALAQALERQGLTMASGPRDAEVVISLHVEQSDERPEQQFGTVFNVRSFSFELSGEAPRFHEMVAMPVVEDVSFDPKFGRERMAERARLIAGEVAERVSTYWEKKTAGR